MNNFKKGDNVYGVIYFSELESYNPMLFDYIYGTIENIKQSEYSDKYIYTIKDISNNRYEDLMDDVIFETKEQMVEYVFKNEKKELNKKLETLENQYNEFQSNKDKFLNDYIGRYNKYEKIKE